MNLLVQLDQVPSLTLTINADISSSNKRSDSRAGRENGPVRESIVVGPLHPRYCYTAGRDLQAMTLYRNSIVTPLLPHRFPTTLKSLAVQTIADKQAQLDGLRRVDGVLTGYPYQVCKATCTR
jgi:hypothetical protein